MGVRVTGQLRVPLRTALVHEPSGATIVTVAPRDSGGDGTRFSPIDMFAASLAACGATAMNLCAQRNGIDLRAVRFSVTSETADDPRRVAKLVVTHEIDADCSEDAYAMLVEAGERCPIRHSIHPDIEVVETFIRGEFAPPRVTGRSLGSTR
jgi:putative redox protein